MQPVPADPATRPAAVEMPPAVWRHYRAFSWVIHEQRIVLLILGFMLAAAGSTWSLALRLRHKAPVVVRAAPSLRELAAAFYGVPEISYDQLAFFLNACLPLLYSCGAEGHPLLPLLQGLVAPEIYDGAERRLNRAAADLRSNGMTQSLTLTSLANVVADAASGRAAADVRGFLTVTVHRSSAQFFPWEAHVLLEANPTSRLNPYPFYLLRFEPRAAPAAAR